MALTKVKGHIIADDLALGGNPTTSTQSTGNNTTRLATTAFVQTELSALVDSSPSALNTLNELAAAMGDDANFSTTVTNSIATKLPLAGGTLTGDVATSGSIIFDNNVQAIKIKDAAGTAGYVFYLDNADTLVVGNGTIVEKIRLDTSGNEGAITIDTNGNVGIGVTSPSAKIHATTATAGYTAKLINTNSSTDANGLLIQAGTASSEYALNVSNTAGNTNFMVVKGNGNVGIGTTAPSSKLQIMGGTSGVDQISLSSNLTDNTAKDAGIVMTMYTNNTAALIGGLAANGNTSLIYGSSGTDHRGVTKHIWYTNTNYNSTSGNTERMRIDSSGNVLIGTTTSPFPNGTGLAVNSSGAISRLILQNSATGTGTSNGFRLGAVNNNVEYENVENGYQAFYNNGAERMRLDSAGDVRLGANATGAALIKGVSGDQTDRNTGGYPQFTFVGNEGTGMRRPITNVLAFDTSGAERMRIDSSGRHYIGKSSSSLATSGIELNPGGYLQVTESQSPALYLSRITDDGNIINFYKTANLMGQIGTYGGTLYIGGGTGNNSSGLMFNGDDIEPTSGSTGRADAAIDLGSGNFRFRHFQFSGGLYGGSELQLGTVGVGAGIAAGSSVARNTSTPDGIFFHNGGGLVDYSIHRTVGAWSGPNYQQLKLQWDTGVIIDGGTNYGKSGVHLKGPVASSSGGMTLQTQEKYGGSGTLTSTGSDVTVVTTTITVLEGSKVAVWFQSGQISNPGNASNPNFKIQWVNSGGTVTDISDHASNHWYYDIGKSTDGRVFMTGQGISGALSAGTYTIRVQGNVYNGTATFNYQNVQSHLILQEISKAL